MSTASPTQFKGLTEKEYKKRVQAWTMYDWANSAFATTILAVVLPVYYSQVAGANLPSEAVATAYWSLGLSISLFIAAVLSPILGTVSDVMRGKKKFLAAFVGFGIVGTGLMVLVDTGDFVLASILFLVGRIGFTAANVFYDALLPHVASGEDQDRVSTRGYAMGYLGGGLLLAINIVMIFVLPGTWGPRLSFLSVAMRWAVFSIPLFRQIPEPPAAEAVLTAGQTVLSTSFNRLKETFQDLKRYRELFTFLMAFLIYNDGIGTIIGVAAIYGAELGFGTIELILALLLVQFVGIPFSLIFGSLPSKKEKRRPYFLAFVIFNMVALPLVGLTAANGLPGEISGAPLPAYQTTEAAIGEGTILAESEALTYSGEWEAEVIPGEVLNPSGLAGFLNNPLGGEPSDAVYQASGQKDARVELSFNGQEVEVTYRTGPDHGIWGVEMDGKPMLNEDTGEALTIDTYSTSVRYGVQTTIKAEEPGEHLFSLVNRGEANAESSGKMLALTALEVLPPIRQSNLGLILGIILAVEAVGVVFARLAGKTLFSKLAETFNTKRSINLALIMYAAIAVWGYFLNSTVEFWFIAWMVAIVQGGSQALSRSLYASMSPAAKSGEFFGFFGVMEKFASLIGPLLFAAAALIFGSSRPAILSLIVLFFLGSILLGRVDVDRGRRIAQEEDATLLKA